MPACFIQAAFSFAALHRNDQTSGAQMNKFFSIAGAAAVAIAFSLSAATPSSADPASDAAAAGFVGGVLGFMAGAAVASGPHHVHTYVDSGDYGYYHHVRVCKRAYGWRYDPESDLVTDRYGDEYPCDL
jgi:hypothetical protein